ncbi:MAG: GDP-L-fucose synthase [Nitrospira sp.]|nr:GDP-L-fucose synthase [Candidatus Brocadiales bacterium]MBL7050287.1 GDP-L-fucose synthase [Nitrospira sp.]
MKKNSLIYIAGHISLAGAAIYNLLKSSGYHNLITANDNELNLTNQSEVDSFFHKEQPEYVFLAASKSGGIMANRENPADFAYQNTMIAANTIHSSYKHNVKRLINIGASCIYPKHANQPMKEEDLMTGPLEPSVEPTGLSKIVSIKLCNYYNRQYGTNFISVTPTNLYGPGDNFALQTAYVIPALIRKFHLAKILSESDMQLIIDDFKMFTSPLSDVTPPPENDSPIAVLSNINIQKDHVTIWGSGKAFREFLYAEDFADACVYLMNNHESANIGEFINVGAGSDISIHDLVLKVVALIGYKGKIVFDSSKPDGPPKKLLDSSLIRSVGWTNKITLDEGLKRTYEWYVSQTD